MTASLDEMKKSHRAVDRAMDELIELMADIEQRAALRDDDLFELQDRTEVLAGHLITHLGARDETERVMDRIFGGESFDLEQLDARLEDVSRTLEEFTGALDELDESTGVEDDQWRRLRRQFDEVVESVRRCSESEWAFYATYTTLLSPGGLGA